jgi:hypothetical protein
MTPDFTIIRCWACTRHLSEPDAEAWWRRFSTGQTDDGPYCPVHHRALEEWRGGAR